MASIGIDLGTTNSLIAYFDGNEPILIKNALGDYLTPSAVSLADDGSILTGKPAMDRLLSHPDRSAASFKRFMGTDRLITLANKVYRAEELSALLLRALVEDAENALKTQISSAVISVPAYFNEVQRKATVDAGRIAGFAVERLVNEPTAAALAHGFNNTEEGKFLIFDLGGGTFDVSILDKYNEVMEITATTGDTHLGGNDFSEVMERMLAGIHQLDIGKLDGKAKATLRRQAEALKMALSRNQTAPYAFTIENQSCSGEIRRPEFETACARLLQRLRTPTERAVRDSGAAVEDFNAIILVGGATRMPMVRSLVSRMFGRFALADTDPDTTVALGAAVQSGLAKRHGALRDVVMTDVSPHTLGVATVDDSESRDVRLSVSPIIERNAIIPISRNITLSTVSDYQTSIAVEVYQGESLRPENNVALGTLRVQVPRSKKGKESIDVRFTYDVNGVIEVEVTSLSTKAVTRSILNNANRQSDSEIAARFKALEKLKLLPRDQMENSALIARAERLYEECRDEMRETVRELIVQFEKDISSQQLRDANACRIHYSKLLDTLESNLSGLY